MTKVYQVLLCVTNHRLPFEGAKERSGALPLRTERLLLGQKAPRRSSFLRRLSDGELAFDENRFVALISGSSSSTNSFFTNVPRLSGIQTKTLIKVVIYLIMFESLLKCITFFCGAAMPFLTNLENNPRISNMTFQSLELCVGFRLKSILTYDPAIPKTQLISKMLMVSKVVKNEPRIVAQFEGSQYGSLLR